jgi:hypothetical protein
MPKLDLREELGLLQLRRDMEALEDEMIDLCMAVECEERPRFYRPLQKRFEKLARQHETLEARWLAS